MALTAALENVRGLRKTLENLGVAVVLLDRLEASIPPSRAQRAPDVKVSKVLIQTRTLPRNEGTVVWATAQTGDALQYTTRIGFHPNQVVHCTCPDLKQRRLPCKHVAALAVECRKRFWSILDILEKDLTQLEAPTQQAVVELATLTAQVAAKETQCDTLSQQAQTALTDSLKALES